MFDLSKASAMLASEGRAWLVTGGAGFIGSHLVSALLRMNQRVTVVDNFSTGRQSNLDDVLAGLAPEQRRAFAFREGDIRDASFCLECCDGIDLVLHQAALGSVPRSIADPLTTNSVNVSGFLNMLDAARQTGVKRFVYAASSSTYGDSPYLPKQEDRIGRPLSPYAVTKLVNELYADVFARQFQLEAVGLRYFNVFGPRQDPNGAYAAVIPRWIQQMLNNQEVMIFGDGQTSRDFCYVDNAVQANLLAALVPGAIKQPVYNVAVGDQTSLARLFEIMRSALEKEGVSYGKRPVNRPERQGDVRHSLADISRIRAIGYEPSHRIEAGMSETVRSFLAATDGMR